MSISNTVHIPFNKQQPFNNDFVRATINKKELLGVYHNEAQSHQQFLIEVSPGTAGFCVLCVRVFVCPY